MSRPEREVPPSDYKRLRRYDNAGEARALNFSCFRNQRFLASERALGWLASAIRAKLPPLSIDFWAYCFMPTHAHIFVFPRAVPCVSGMLAAVKKSVCLRAVIYVERHAPHFLRRMSDVQPNGSVVRRFWQRGGGFDRNLVSARAIWNMIDYIHQNPVEEGLVRRATDWKWSSASWFRENRPGPLDLQLDKLPGRPRA